jgi:hypothetical protein
MKLTESALRNMIKQELQKVINEMAKLDPAVAAARASKAAETRKQNKEFYAQMDAKRDAELAAARSRTEAGYAPEYANPPYGKVPNPAFYDSKPDARSGYMNYKLKDKYKNVRGIGPIYIDAYEESPFGYEPRSTYRDDF